MWCALSLAQNLHKENFMRDILCRSKQLTASILDSAHRVDLHSEES